MTQRTNDRGGALHRAPGLAVHAVEPFAAPRRGIEGVKGAAHRRIGQQPALTRGGKEGKIERVLRGIVAGQRGSAQHGVFIRALHERRGARIAQTVLCERAGLVGHQRVHRRSLLNSGQPRDQHALVRQQLAAHGCGQGVGGRQRHRHRGHQQHEREHCRVEQGQVMPQREADDDGHEHEVEYHQPFDDGEDGALHVAGRVGGAHQFGGVAEEGACAGRGDDTRGLALSHDGAGVGRLARTRVHRQRFAGERRLIE